MKSISLAAFAVALGLPHIASAKDVAFIACPIVRDTSSVPCWLSESDGQLYYMGIQTDVSADFSPPSLGHKVLVEGTVSPDEEVCGGKVLNPVTVSVLPELSPECNTILMAEARYELPFEAPRPPGPSMGSLAFTQPRPPALPEAPFPEQTFTINYDFDGKVNFQTPRSLQPILRYAQHVNASRIEITGYRGAVQLSSGELAEEREDIAQVRADQVAELLQGAGLDQPEYIVHASAQPQIGGPEQRKVTVRILPGA